MLALLFAQTVLVTTPDPCALRALLDAPSDALVVQAHAAQGRARACLDVVAARALARDGHGSDAVALYDEAAVLLPELGAALELAKKRALGPPPKPPSIDDDSVPATAGATAEKVQALLRAARPHRAATVALGFPRAGAVDEGLEVATVTALVRADRIDEALTRAAALPESDAFSKVRAWCLSKAGKYVAARDAYAHLAATTPDPALKAEATFYAGFSAYEGSTADPALFADARARFVDGAELLKGSPFEAFARWYTAFSFVLENKPKEAVPVLEALVKDLPQDRESLKHRYWLGRARIDSGDARGGKRELTAVADLEPTDYYGLLARRRLNKAPVKGTHVADDAVVRLARNDDDAGRAVLMWNLGLDDDAQALARGLGEGLPEIGLQQSLDDAHFGWRRGARYIPAPRTRGGALVNNTSWRVSYATPWRAAVDAAAHKSGIPSSFLYAIMRTESGFDPRAVSVAGARGVIQLLPSAARGACTLAGRPVDDAERIFRPEVAIDLGAALLGAERTELGSLALAAAAYNGAAPNVVKWLHAHGALEPELFIERIPFRETRDYVKRVLAVEATYRALDGQPLSIDLPASLGPAPATVTDFPMNE